MSSERWWRRWRGGAVTAFPGRRHPLSAMGISFRASEQRTEDRAVRDQAVGCFWGCLFWGPQALGAPLLFGGLGGRGFRLLARLSVFCIRAVPLSKSCGPPVEESWIQSLEELQSAPRLATAQGGCGAVTSCELGRGRMEMIGSQ